MANESLRVRKSVYSAAGELDLQWYAKAVAAARKTTFQDPRSWCYLAAVHGIRPPATPYAACPGSKPPAKDQALYWQQCQHQTWYFLPWHRGYVAYFEQIMGAHVTDAGGPAGWALPYWNYSADTPEARQLPPAFLPDKEPDGSPNPLFSPNRALTKGKSLPKSYVSLAALAIAQFAGDSVDPAFGGPQTTFSHSGQTSGGLENVPHNVVHTGVGGWMNNPNSAALDPIFWLHHANIDRLWAVWNGQGAQFQDPTDAAWLSGVNFQLHDKTGAVVTFDSANMRDPATILGGYTYDDLTPPPPPAIAVAAQTRQAMVAETHSPQLVGNTNEPTSLDGTETKVKVGLAQPRAQAMAARATTRPPRAFLNLENVTGLRSSVVYEIFIDVPDGKGGETRLPAGLLSSFGVRAASERDSLHGGTGITTSIEITPIVEQLRKEGRWDDSHLDVTFVREEHGAETDADAGRGDLKVGRISVFYK